MVMEKIIEVPEDLLKALSKNKAAEKFFTNLGYGYKKDYVEMVTSAKRADTRTSRIAKIVLMCADEMKPNDKYKK